jgi:predicted dehydrogenase
VAGRTFAGPDGVVRVGIVGCGDVTEVKSGPAFQKLPGSALTAVMRRDGAKAEDYARRHGVPRWTDDARDLIHGDDVDLVYVATPPSSHAAYVEMAAATGKPVYVEKPMATTLLEAERMLGACRRAGVPLYVAYYRRAQPRFARARALLMEGAIGEVRAVRMTLAGPVGPAADDPDQQGWRFDPEVAGGGLLMDLGSHQLDLLDHWLGPVVSVEAEARTLTPGSVVADEISARLTFDGGAHGTALWSFASATSQDEILVLGRRGRLSVPVFADGPIVWSGPDGQEHSETIVQPEHAQQPLIRQMIDELRGVGGPCASTGVSAARTQGVLDAILLEHRRARVAAAGPG